ncbi:MAG: ferrochelatase [Rhodospirillaceae bacterium]|nr:ferrochelatase [Rhodospirillaceae bacterium]MYB14075.1 ferrochelatase [Rhodospirillaceae bacterium]MYI48152.1 ferrochelatase [Rhodospirillaceae bacterium]
MSGPKSDTAVILFNLGGPTAPDTVKPFLFNLFNDRAIVGAPQPVRWLLAKLIAGRRAPVARDIYAHLGGKSPIHEETDAQAAALEAVLRERLGPAGAPSVHVVMRYWGRRAEAVARDLAGRGVRRTVLLPLYPQFSTTTSASSVREWSRWAAKTGLGPAAGGVCCYPANRGFVAAMADRIAETLAGHDGDPPRILFSAHGLPEKVIAAGDPYRWQVEQTAAALAEALDGSLAGAAADSVVCYQSRVGPLKWIGPSTEDEIRRAGAEKRPVLVAPVAFVSEHSETLVELDIEYRKVAEAAGVPAYLRAPTAGAHPAFIGGLADMVETILARGGLESDCGGRLCPGAWRACPLAAAAPGAV